MRGRGERERERERERNSGGEKGRVRGPWREQTNRQKNAETERERGKLRLGARQTRWEDTEQKQVIVYFSERDGRGTDIQREREREREGGGGEGGGERPTEKVGQFKELIIITQKSEMQCGNSKQIFKSSLLLPVILKTKITNWKRSLKGSMVENGQKQKNNNKKQAHKTKTMKHKWATCGIRACNNAFSATSH